MIWRAATHRIFRSQRIARRAAALLAGIAVLASGMVLAETAQAAINTRVMISEALLQHAGGGVKVGDQLDFTGTWDASAASPRPGDQFVIGLPAELGFPQALPIRLLGEDGTIWGECLTDPDTDTVTCELSDAVASRPDDVGGNFQFTVEATKATTAQDLIFDLNGVDTPVAVPGGAGIAPAVVPPAKWTKSGTLNGDKASVTWRIDLPGSRLTGTQQLRILDELIGEHALCQPVTVTVQAVKGSAVTTVPAAAAIAADVESPYSFAVDLVSPAGGFDAAATYRLTYSTCTPGGRIDPQGTSYGNRAAIPVWGEDSGTVRVVQTYAPSTEITKEGRVQGGTSRNSSIEWTVTIPGDQLVGRTSFRFSDSLAGPHTLCRDSNGSYAVQNLQLEQRQGPSSTTITRLPETTVARQTLSAMDTRFEVEFSIADASFRFQASPYLYTVRYHTCAATDGLPTGGTKFSNTASVNGAAATATATVGTRDEGKTGAISTTAVTIGGVQRAPQTTMNWSITIPGERLAELTGPATIRDSLSANHTVCGSGDTVTRLGLHVEARDQIRNGGLATVDITDSVTAALDANTAVVTIDPPTLPGADGTSHIGFSRDYQFVVTYTTCTTSGGMDAVGTRYDNTAAVAGRSYSRSVTQQSNGSASGRGVRAGSISIVKSLADNTSASYVPAGTVFTVHVAEIDPQGVTRIEYDLEVPLDGEPVSGLNSRGPGWTAVVTEPTTPTVDGVSFGTPQFQPSAGVTVSADGSRATATLTPATNIGIALTNTTIGGQLRIEKTVAGTAAGTVNPDREYRITATIDTTALGSDFPAQPPRHVTVSPNRPVTIGDLPIGGTVTLTETLPDDDDQYNWKPATIEPGVIQVTRDSATTPIRVQVTNSVDRPLGTFALRKTVVGDQAANDAVPSTVQVRATWTLDGEPDSTTLSVPTDGDRIEFGLQLPRGTQVRLSELGLADGNSISWGAPTWSGTGVVTDGDDAIVTIGADPSAQIDLVNHANTATATFSLAKAVTGDASDRVDSGLEYAVTASWTGRDGTPNSRELILRANETATFPEDLPAGTIVTLKEHDLPVIASVRWGTPRFAGSAVTDHADGTARVTVAAEPDAVTLVILTNTASLAPGTLTIVKKITGNAADHPDLPASVDVIARWDADQATIAVPLDGTPAGLGRDLPAGTRITLEEVLPDIDSISWGTPRWSGNGLQGKDDGTAEIIIGAGSTAELELTNTAETRLGSLTIQKDITGAAADMIVPSTEYRFTIDWVDHRGASHMIETTVRAGSRTIIAELPVGAIARIQEVAPDVPSGVDWSGCILSIDDGEPFASRPGDCVLMTEVHRDHSVLVHAVNGFNLIHDRDLSGSASNHSAETALADTGVGGATAASAASILIGLGLCAILTARRRSRRS